MRNGHTMSIESRQLGTRTPWRFMLAGAGEVTRRPLAPGWQVRIAAV
jgi:hypothetical protein